MPRRSLFAVPALALAIAALPSAAFADSYAKTGKGGGPSATAQSHGPAGHGAGRRIR
jgi:hypothetical protein